MSLSGESLGSLRDEYVTFNSCYCLSSTGSLTTKRIDIKRLYFFVTLEYCERTPDITNKVVSIRSGTVLNQASTYYRASAYLQEAQKEFLQDSVRCNTNLSALHELDIHRWNENWATLYPLPYNISLEKSHYPFSILSGSMESGPNKHPSPLYDVGSLIRTSDDSDRNERSIVRQAAKSKAKTSEQASRLSRYPSTNVEAVAKAFVSLKGPHPMYTERIFDSRADEHQGHGAPLRKGRQGAPDQEAKDKQRALKEVGACWKCKILKKSVRQLENQR